MSQPASAMTHAMHRATNVRMAKFFIKHGGTEITETHGDFGFSILDYDAWSRFQS
jgi:hypothetical protein